MTDVRNPMPTIPPKKTINEKIVFVKNDFTIPLLDAISSGISYYPSIENNLNALYNDANGFEKFGLSL